MQNILKRFGVKGIDSFSGQFQRSRMVLTLVYVVILATILFSSASITRYIFSQRLDDRFSASTEYSEPPTERMLPPPKVEDVRADFLQATLIVNGTLLLIAAGLSYLLAGITLRPIQSAYNKQRQFLSDASHELRTPLAILRTDLENELAAVKIRDERRSIESHLEEVERMSRLVDDLLILSRLDGDERPNRKMIFVDLGSVLNATVERMQPMAQKYEVELLISENGILEVAVQTPDEDLLTRAITNILQNAILYNKKHGRVDVAGEVQGEFAVITIKDTGIGVAEDDLKNIFDRFYRSEKSRSRQAGGSGLGLSIVQSIAHTLGGSITITSELGKGSVALLKFPIHKAS